MLWNVDVARRHVTLLFRRDRRSYLYSEQLDEMPNEQKAAERFVVAWKDGLTEDDIAAMDLAAYQGDVTR